MLDVYFELNPSFCQPPYTRTVNAFLEEKSRGVRGAAHDETGGNVYSITNWCFTLVTL